MLATKTSALQALLSQHNLRLSPQPDDLRRTVVSDLQAADVPIDSDTRQVRFTDPAQIDTMVEVYKRHSLLPSDASID